MGEHLVFVPIAELNMSFCPWWSSDMVNTHEVLWSWRTYLIATEMKWYIYILIHDTCICRIRSNHQHETCSWTVQVAMQAEFRQLDNKVSCLMSRCNGWMNGFGGSTSVKNQLRSLHYQRCLVLLKPNIFFKNACSLALVTWFTFLHGTSLFGPLVLSTSGDIPHAVKPQARVVFEVLVILRGLLLSLQSRLVQMCGICGIGK